MQDWQHEATMVQVRALLADQMPDLAGFPIKRVSLTGTDHALYRLGPDLIARFPLRFRAEGQISVQAQWLPHLATALPLAVPLVQRFGMPGEGYPYRWAVMPWLHGHAAFTGPLDQMAAAPMVADFLRALQGQPQPEGAPKRGMGDRLDQRFADIGVAIGQFQGEADPVVLAKVAAALRKLPQQSQGSVWVHGDLHPLNLLAQRGRLTGLVDWGGLGVGDPGTDLMIGWTLFDAPARAAFRKALAPAPISWARGRAQAFAKAVTAVPYYRRANPGFHAVMLRTLNRVLEDWGAGAIQP